MARSARFCNSVITGRKEMKCIGAKLQSPVYDIYELFEIDEKAMPREQNRSRLCHFVWNNIRDKDRIRIGMKTQRQFKEGAVGGCKCRCCQIVFLASLGSPRYYTSINLRMEQDRFQKEHIKLCKADFQRSISLDWTKVFSPKYFRWHTRGNHKITTVILFIGMFMRFCGFLPPTKDQPCQISVSLCSSLVLRWTTFFD